MDSDASTSFYDPGVWIATSRQERKLDGMRMWGWICVRKQGLYCWSGHTHCFPMTRTKHRYVDISEDDIRVSVSVGGCICASEGQARKKKFFFFFVGKVCCGDTLTPTSLCCHGFQG